jgi:hypothetical protein
VLGSIPPGMGGEPKHAGSKAKVSRLANSKT